MARRATGLFNTGAYADIGPRVIKNAGYGTPGPYAIPNVHVDTYAVYTNLPPAGAFRGYGQPQAAWAYETQMDAIADRLAIDPLELRRINLLRSGDRFHTGEDVGHVRFADLLERAAQAIGWEWPAPPVRAGNRVRAKGFACALKGTVTPSTSTATVRLNDDGSVNVLTSSVEMGQGLQTAMAILAAERLAVPVTAVHVSGVDTAVTPYDQQTSSSRSTHCMGNAVLDACAHVDAALRSLAARPLDAEAAELVLRDGHVAVAGAPERRLRFADVIRTARAGNVIGHGRFHTEGGLDRDTGQGVATVHWHQAAGAAEVEVDLETGKVEVLRYYAATYAGRVVNPDMAALQAHGNVAFGVGQALFEEMTFDEGQLLNGNLGEYMIAGLHDLPRSLIADTVEEDDPGAEIHGLGETALPPVAPAIGNAVSRALGRRFVTLPLTPERVLREVRAGGPVEAGRP